MHHKIKIYYLPVRGGDGFLVAAVAALPAGTVPGCCSHPRQQRLALVERLGIGHRRNVQRINPLFAAPGATERSGAGGAGSRSRTCGAPPDGAEASEQVSRLPAPRRSGPRQPPQPLLGKLPGKLEHLQHALVRDAVVDHAVAPARLDEAALTEAGEVLGDRGLPPRKAVGQLADREILLEPEHLEDTDPDHMPEAAQMQREDSRARTCTFISHFCYESSRMAACSASRPRLRGGVAAVARPEVAHARRR